MTTKRPTPEQALVVYYANRALHEGLDRIFVDGGEIQMSVLTPDGRTVAAHRWTAQSAEAGGRQTTGIARRYIHLWRMVEDICAYHLEDPSVKIVGCTTPGPPGARRNPTLRATTGREWSIPLSYAIETALDDAPDQIPHVDPRIIKAQFTPKVSATTSISIADTIARTVMAINPKRFYFRHIWELIDAVRHHVNPTVITIEPYGTKNRDLVGFAVRAHEDDDRYREWLIAAEDAKNTLFDFRPRPDGLGVTDMNEIAELLGDYNTWSRAVGPITCTRTKDL